MGNTNTRVYFISVVQKFQITIKERTKLKSKIQED